MADVLGVPRPENRAQVEVSCHTYAIRALQTGMDVRKAQNHSQVEHRKPESISSLISQTPSPPMGPEGSHH